MACASTVTVWRVTVWEDSDPTFYARVVVDSAGTKRYLLQADLSAVTYAVFDRGTSVGTGTVTISSSVYDTLQTGTAWDYDATGYNFRVQLAAALFPTGGRTNRVEFKFTTTGGQAFWLVYDAVTQNVYTS